jgi:hypothetical protein
MKTLEEIAIETLAIVLIIEEQWRNAVQVGDFVDAGEDHYFLHGGKYLTKNKLYQVKELDFRPKEQSYTVIVDSDITKETTHISMNHLIIRNGIVIWNWYEDNLHPDEESYGDYLLRARHRVKEMQEALEAVANNNGICQSETMQLVHHVLKKEETKNDQK